MKILIIKMEEPLDLITKFTGINYSSRIQLLAVGAENSLLGCSANIVIFFRNAKNIGIFGDQVQIQEIVEQAKTLGHTMVPLLIHLITFEKGGHFLSCMLDFGLKRVIVFDNENIISAFSSSMSLFISCIFPELTSYIKFDLPFTNPIPESCVPYSIVICKKVWDGSIYSFISDLNTEKYKHAVLEECEEWRTLGVTEAAIFETDWWKLSHR